MYENLPKLKATPPPRKRGKVVMLVAGVLSAFSFALAGVASAAHDHSLPGHIIEGIHTFQAV